MAAKSRQSSFRSPIEKANDVLARAGRQEFDSVVIAHSGGTDSTLAAYLAAVLGPEHGIEPDVVIHANTGISLPQTQLVTQVFAAMHSIPYIEGNNGTLAERVLKHGWPAETAEGHFYERIERKSDVFDKLHASISGEQLWISGARSNESKQRSMNVPDSGVERDSRRARQTWCSPCTGITTDEKWDLIEEYALPVSESYETLGISGECLACAFDDAGLLTDLDILAPNLAWAIRNLTAWLYRRARRGEAGITPKQLCWGWSPKTDDTSASNGQQSLTGDDVDTDGAWIGCNATACGQRDVPDQVFDLPDWQIVTLDDVHRYWGAPDTPELVGRFGQ